MIIDPHIAIIRTSIDHVAPLYEAVMQRIADRSEQPRGVLLHFAALQNGKFLVGTIFRDNETMLEGFLGFTAPETQNEMVSSGRPADITRDQYPLERLLVADEVEARPFSFQPAGEIAACSSDAADIPIDVHRSLVAESGQNDAPVPGRLATIAYQVGAAVHAVDFWESRERGQAYYEEHVYPVYEELRPGRITEETIEKSWMKLHAFVVCSPADDPQRNFLRSTDGPVQV